MVNLTAQQYVGLVGEVHIIQRTWPAPNLKSASSSPRASTNEWTIYFNCVVGTGQWQLEGNFTSNGHETWHFNGTNICVGTRIVKEPPREIATNNALGAFFPPLDEVKSDLSVSIHETVGYPQATVGVNVAWLALCSGPYLKKEGRVLPMTAGEIGHQSDIYGYSDVTRTYDDPLGLPKKVEFLTSAARYEASVREFFEPRFGTITNFQVSGYPDGVRKFHYVATDSTNFAGWNFPLEFEFGEDVPDDFWGSFRSHFGHGKVTRVFTSPPPRGAFDASMKQTVIDWRFKSETREVDAITYPSTNTFIAPKEDTDLQTRFAKTVKHAPLKPASRQAQAEASPATVEPAK